jgi:hypothetical protein
MQSAINELTESLTKKDEIIATKEGIARERFARIREMANMTHQKEDEHLWEKNKLQMEIKHLMKLNENEVASKEWHEKRFLEEKAEYSVRTVQASTRPPTDDLREKLRIAEERAQQHYDEMKEYQSWLKQVEEGQETLKGSNDPEYDPVPDNPPGLRDRKDVKDASLANSDIGQDGKDWVTRISRKEHERVVDKPWPKCQDLDVWRSNVLQAVCVASGDPDTAAWRRWLTPAQLPDPDYAELADSGDFRFQSIDSKLSIALQNMVDAAGEVASEVRVRKRQRSQVLGREGNFLMGREILAMILDHFRTTSEDEVLFNASHIYKLQYRGDKEMDKFLNAWIEIIANILKLRTYRPTTHCATIC